MTVCVDLLCYLQTDPETMKDVWSNDFKLLYNPQTDSSFDENFKQQVLNHKDHLERRMLDPLYQSNADLNRQIDINLMINEVRCVVNKAKAGKSAGIDELPYEVLKSENVIQTLHKMFMLIFDTNITPFIWRRAIICPILKDTSSDPRIPLNYRGISLQCVTAKIFSSVLNNRLMVYLEDNELLVDEQNGFRRQRSCLDHIFSLNSVIQNNNSTFVTFIDLQKAFDTVDRELLQYCLLTHGIDGNFYHSIKSLYSNTESCVRLNDKYTDWFRCSVGVRQGDNLSPTLFALFINDLAVKLKTLNKGAQINNYNLSLLLYADDIALISHSENDMQHMLDTVDAWCRKWRLRINSQKSKVVHFRKNRSKRSNFNFHLGENNLDYEASYKYLGVIFDEKRGFKVNAENLSMSGGRALGSVISKINAIKSVGFRTYEKLFNNCVAPVLDYSSGVWGHKKHHCIEMVQNRVLRYISLVSISLLRC